MTGPTADQAELAASAEEPRNRVMVFVRPTGAPLTLGFFGLAGATFVLSGLQLGWLGPAEGQKVAVALVGFAAVAQSLAAVLSFLARDGVAGDGDGGVGARLARYGGGSVHFQARGDK